MAERLELEIVLTDKVTAATKQIMDALKAMEASAKKAGGSSFPGIPKAQIDKQQKAWENMWGKVGMAANQAAYKQQQSFANMWQKIGMAKAKADAESTKGITAGLHGAAESFGSKLKHVITGVAIGELVAHGLEKGLEFLKEGITEVFSAAAHEEQKSLAFKLTLGADAGKELQEQIDDIYKKTPFIQGRVEDMALGLKNAGFSAREMWSTIAGAGDIEALTGGKIKGEEFAQSMENIKLRGGIGRKQLVGMHLNAPEFYKKIATDKGISTKAAEKLASAGGGMDPKELMDRIFGSIEKRTGKQLGGAGEDLSKTVGAQFDKIKNLPEQYFKHIADSPAWQRLGTTMSHLLDALSPDKEPGKGILTALIKAFDTLLLKIEAALTPENIEAFSKGIQKALTFLGDMPNILDKIVTVSEILMTIWAGGKIVSAITAVTGGITALSIPLIALAAAAVGIYGAYKHLKDVEEAAQKAVSDPTRVNEFSSADKRKKATERAQGIGGYEGGFSAAPKVASTSKTNNISVPNMNVNITSSAENFSSQEVAMKIHSGAVSGFESAAIQSGI